METIHYVAYVLGIGTSFLTDDEPQTHVNDELSAILISRIVNEVYKSAYILQLARFHDASVSPGFETARRAM